jgi:hypothetical protein
MVSLFASLVLLFRGWNRVFFRFRVCIMVGTQNLKSREKDTVFYRHDVVVSVQNNSLL